MKKIICLFLCLSVITLTHAQTTWNLSLNTVAGSPNFGTLNNKPIDFFTNNTKRMTLGTDGSLLINGLAGSGSRFLQVDASGVLTPWIGSAPNYNKILFGDNTWKVFPFTTDGDNTYMDPGKKFGVGTSSPASELDVNGGAQINNGLRIGEGLYIGPTDNYGLIRYTPGTSGSPAVFSFGGGGLTHPNNPSPNSPYNPYSGGHGAGDYSADPQPSSNCAGGNIAATTMNVFSDFLTVKKVGQFAVGLIGNINLGHNGVNAFIETQGTNANYPNAGDLYMNAECNRNIYAFSNGSSFAVGTNNVMSIAGRLNVTQNMQIGGGTSTTGFLNNTAMLYIHAPASSAAGIRIYHGGGVDAGIKIIESTSSKKALSINLGTTSSDGSEQFTVYGDGKTEIASGNSDALVIKNGSGGSTTFNVKSDGKTYVSSNMGIGALPSAGTFLNINAGLNSSNSDLIAVGSANTPDAVKIDSKGMTLHTVNGISAGSVFKIKTPSTDLFAVRYDGVAFARELVVTLAAFPDYVFAKEYQLRQLSDVKKYIIENKRLPNMPSAEEVQKNGAALGEMQRLSIEKIEELYLYIFQLEEKIEALNAEVKSIKK